MPILHEDLCLLTSKSVALPTLVHHFRNRELTRREIAKLKPMVSKFRYSAVDLSAFTSVFYDNAPPTARPTAPTL